MNVLKKLLKIKWTKKYVVLMELSDMILKERYLFDDEWYLENNRVDRFSNINCLSNILILRKTKSNFDLGFI